MSAQTKAEKPHGQPPPPALRLRVRWRRGDWQPVKLVRLPSKALPDAVLPDPGKGKPPLQGLWVEALDASGRVIERRRILEPLPTTLDRAVKQGIMARAANPDEFLLDLLLPAYPDITAVRLLANPNPFQPQPQNALDKASVLVVFELKAFGDHAKPKAI